jgi:F-type H+-transporting ATPase subunit c
MLKKITLFTLSLFVLAIPAFAQAGAADNESTVTSSKAFAIAIAVLGFGIAAGLASLGQGKIGAAALEGTARNPSAAGKIQTMMILGLAFIESLVIFALVIFFAKGISL